MASNEPLATSTIATEEAIAQDIETLDPTEANSTIHVEKEHDHFLSDADDDAALDRDSQNLEDNLEHEIKVSNEHKRGSSELVVNLLGEESQEHDKDDGKDDDDDCGRAHKMAKYEEAHSYREERRDEYVRLSTNLRQLVGEALQRAVDSVQTALKPRNNQDNQDSSSQDDPDPEDLDDLNSSETNIPQDLNYLGSARMIHKYKFSTRNERYAAELAQKKSAECMQLEHQLKESNAANALFEQTNATLRLSVQQHQQRHQNTTEALRIAANNAANARADADAAQHKAAGLLDQLSQLKRAVEECKAACNAVKEEHEGISSATRGLEGQLMQVHAELRKTQKVCDKKSLDLLKIQQENQSNMDSKEELQSKLDMHQKELTRWKRMDAQRILIEEQRISKLKCLESDLSKTKHLVLQASNSAAEQEATAASLNETLAELKAENLRLHAQLQQSTTKNKTERERWSDELGKAEMEGQKLRMQSETYVEEIGRFKLDAKSTEKQVQQLKGRIASLERRLTDAQKQQSVSTVTPSLLSSSTVESSSSPHSSVVVPPLRSSTSSAKKHKPKLSAKTRDNNPLSSISNVNEQNCALCGQTPFGLMKSCQCVKGAEKDKCKLRAHVSCITRSSGSVKSTGILCGNGGNCGGNLEA
mmetsp:Transcript_24429/g.36580  ORF Transcript_24429/g.36580 Transcript_24429/m.36580 type:complete len:647 (-) Transcript_24429:196-2136(-)